MNVKPNAVLPYLVMCLLSAQPELSMARSIPSFGPAIPPHDMYRMGHLIAHGEIMSIETNQFRVGDVAYPYRAEVHIREALTGAVVGDVVHLLMHDYDHREVLRQPVQRICARSAGPDMYSGFFIDEEKWNAVKATAESIAEHGYDIHYPPDEWRWRLEQVRGDIREVQERYNRGELTLLEYRELIDPLSLESQELFSRINSWGSIYADIIDEHISETMMLKRQEKAAERALLRGDLSEEEYFAIVRPLRDRQGILRDELRNAMGGDPGDRGTH